MAKNTKNNNLVESLNKALAQEHACIIRYRTHASLVTGLAAESLLARFHEIADDETRHAQDLRDRIVALGGIPTGDVEEVEIATDVKKMLSINIKEEKKAIAMYQKVLKEIPRSELVLFETMEHILLDEQEHLEELERLAG